MIQPAFNIGNTDHALEVTDGQVLVELSAQSLNFIFYKKDPGELLLLRQYRLYTSSEKSANDIIGEIIKGDPVLEKYAPNALIVYNFPESSIVPGKYAEPDFNGAVSSLIYGDDPNDFIFGEPVKDLGMCNVYRIPKAIHTLLKEKFPGCTFRHLYTMMLLAENKIQSDKSNTIRTVFYHDKFICSLFTGPSLQLLQTFNYQTPEDAAYYLLLVCKQFNIVVADMLLCVSGLIDSESSLYTELLKYFPDVTEEGVPDEIESHDLLKDYPVHYFSPLLKMSLCAL